jgi:hypothetical protein
MNESSPTSFRLVGSTLGKGREILFIIYLLLSGPIFLVSLFIGSMEFLSALIRVDARDAVIALCNAAFIGHIVGLVLSFKPVSRHPWIWCCYTLGAASELGLAAFFFEGDSASAHVLFYLVTILFACAVVGTVSSLKFRSQAEDRSRSTKPG